MSRGKPKPKLRDISRHRPSREEVMKVFDAVYQGQTAAILGAAMVEYELEGLLRHRLRRQTDKEWDALVGENGPLSTFYQKILLGRAFRLYDKEVEENLDTIRGIRNAFAHAKNLIDFDHDLIVAALKSVKVPREYKRAHREIKALKFGPAGSWLSLCHYTSMVLLRRHNLILKALNRHYKKKRARVSPLARVLSRAAQAQSNALSHPQSSLPDQTYGPIPEAPLGLLGALLQKTPRTRGNGDK
jgi:hypothetical protein